jgi:peptidylprolyl isomerase
MSDQVKAGSTPNAAQQPTAVERLVAAKRRSQAVIGALAGVAVIAVLIGVFVWVKHVDDNKSAAPAAASTAAAQLPPTDAPPTEQAPPTDAPPAAEPPAAEPPAGQQPPLPPGMDKALATKPVVKGAPGPLPKLVVTTLIKGKGPATKTGQTVTVNYVGVLYNTGVEFDASWKRGQPYPVENIGAGQVIEGWNKGLVGVPVGSRVQLDIPTALAYGDNPPQGYPVGPLRFVVDVLAAQ